MCSYSGLKSFSSADKPRGLGYFQVIDYNWDLFQTKASIIWYLSGVVFPFTRLIVIDGNCHTSIFYQIFNGVYV